MVQKMSSENIIHNETDDELQNDFIEYDLYDLGKSPWEKLWLGVLVQQFKDAEGLENTRPEIRNNAKRAINWLHNDSQDFDDVCVLAGFDPSYTKLRVQRWLKLQYPHLLRDGWFVPPDLGTLKRRK